jgi:hypothetical protein
MSSEIQFLAFGTGNGFIINKEQSIIITILFFVNAKKFEDIEINLFIKTSAHC